MKQSKVGVCDVCGKVPALRLEQTKVIGLVVGLQTERLDATLCSAHGMELRGKVKAYNRRHAWWTVLWIYTFLELLHNRENYRIFVKKLGDAA
jgi:hypothetical protein